MLSSWNSYFISYYFSRGWHNAEYWNWAPLAEWSVISCGHGGWAVSKGRCRDHHHDPLPWMGSYYHLPFYSILFHLLASHSPPPGPTYLTSIPYTRTPLFTPPYLTFIQHVALVIAHSIFEKPAKPKESRINDSLQKHPSTIQEIYFSHHKPPHALVKP